MRIERFTIDVVDENGTPTTLHGRRTIRSYPTLSGRPIEAPTLAELFESTGDPVNSLDDDTFEGVLSGKKYRKR